MSQQKPRAPGGKQVLPSGIFEDFNFRFSNTYTVVDSDGKAEGKASGSYKPRRPGAKDTTTSSSRPSPAPAAAAPSSSRLNHLLFGSSTTSSIGPSAAADRQGLHLTASLVSELRQQEQKSRRLQQQKTEKQAATLLTYARSRKPQVAPSFLPGTESHYSAAAAAATPGLRDEGDRRSNRSSSPQQQQQQQQQQRPEQEQEQHAVREGLYKPIMHSLPPPALGYAAGVAAGVMSEETDVFPLNREEQAAVLQRERHLNSELFEWWDHREAVRSQEKFCAEMEDALKPVLEGNAKEMIAKEESYWLGELCGGQPGLQGTQVSVNPKLKTTATVSTAKSTGSSSSGGGGGGVDMMAQNNGLTNAGATSRGLIVPIKSLETLFRGLRVMLHERASALLSTYEESQWTTSHAFRSDVVDHLVKDESEDNETENLHDSTDIHARQKMMVKAARRAYLKRLCETENELAKDAVAAAASSSPSSPEAGITPACVSLPPDRMLQPLMVVETAVSVSLLWKILEQVQTVVPGMDFALQLYRHYIMPHLYYHYSAMDGVLPHQMGSLGDQMSRLCALPLRAKTHLLASEAVKECKEDVKYMEFTMKAWALRTWRKSVADKHRQTHRRVVCLSLLERATRRATLRAAFMAWRAETRENAYAHYLRSVDREYRAFLAGSALSTQMDCLPVTVATSDGTNVTYNNRARVIATKLAENATHDYKKAKNEAKLQKQRASRFSPSRVIGDNNVFLPPIQQQSLLSSSSQQQQQRCGSAGGVGTRSSRRGTPAPGDATEGGGAAAAGAVEEAERDSAADTTARLRSIFRGQRENGEIESDRGHSDRGEASDGDDRAGTPAGGTRSHSRTVPRILSQEDGRAGGADREAAAGGDSGDGDGDGSGGGDTPKTWLPRPRSAKRDSTGIQAFASMTTGPFEEMLARLQETEEVCTHLRGEIAVQARMIRKLEQDKRGLQDRNRTLEANLLKTVEEKLHFCNVVQEKQFCLQERDRRILQLKSRLRAHRNRPWQRVVMRVMGELCSSSTQVAEALDEYRIRRDWRSDPNSTATRVKGPGSGAEEETEDEGDDVTLGALIDDGPGAREAEQQRLFGELAPIVLSSTRQLPDALLILQDWANSALDDLQSLDDLKGGALSVRFSSFSEEARSGVLLSRLLFYLALPRYLHRTATNGDDGQGNGSPDKKQRRRGKNKGKDASDDFFGSDYPDRRRQLLEQRNVQLDTPFPVYSDCFGDLLSMRPNERMTLLLQFATELVAGADAPASDALALKRHLVEEAVFAATDMAPPLSAGRIELQEVVDPHSLAAGERASVVTFVALLYTRFAHPFCHKCKQSAAVERAAMLQLLSGDGATLANSEVSGDGAILTPKTTLEEELLAHLDNEDKSPWQLFKERCLPVFGSEAHPFLLRGNFWPCDAFDSPALASLLGELGMALNRSLQLHRWHVILSCLVPVVTYSGLSRAVFTGPRASPAALRVGLEQEGDWEFPLHGSCIKKVCERRGIALGFGGRGGGSGGGHARRATAEGADGASPLELHVKDEKTRLMEALKVTSEDLLTLFLRRSVLSAELALPTMDLGGWRLLCGDLAFVGMELGDEDSFPLDLEVATYLYFEAVATLNETAEKPSPFIGTAMSESKAGPPKPEEPLADPSLANTAEGDSSPMPLTKEMLMLNQKQQQQQHPSEPTSSQGSPLQCDPSEGFQSVSGRPGVGKGKVDPFTQLPLVHMAMTFTAFATAMVLVADRLFPASTTKDAETGAEPEEDKRPHRWLGDALRALIYHHVIETPAGNSLVDEPRVVIRRLKMGATTQEVIAMYTPALTLIFNAYSKDVYGAAGMEKEDLLKLLRDAMLTSTEISQYLIYELFQYCCVTRRSQEEEAAAKRRELDNKPRLPASANSGRRRLGRAVSILDPRTHTVSLSTGKRRDIQILVMEGFIEFLCVLCHFKQPNPLIPVYQRLNVFLRRSVLRPLSHKVEGITSFLNQLKMTKEAQEGAENNSAHGSDN